jgi:hypothetical protein
MTSYYQASIITLFFALLLTSCMNKQATGSTEMDSQEKAAIAALAWLDTANAESDAKTAVAKGQLSLLSMGGRGGVLPGIPLEQTEQYTDKCGVSIIPGATDVVRGNAHLEYLQRAREYAETYNKIVVQYC